MHLCIGCLLEIRGGTFGSFIALKRGDVSEGGGHPARHADVHAPPSPWQHADALVRSTAHL